MSTICIKFDINDLEKYLLDSDGNVKLEIGNAIVQEFTKRHLKSLAEKISQQTLGEEFKTALQEYIISQYEWRDKECFTDKGREAIRKCVEWQISSTVEKAVTDISNENLTQYIEGEVAYYVQHFIDKTIRSKAADISQVVQNAINRAISGKAVEES